MNRRSMVYMDAYGRTTIVHNLSDAPRAVRGQRIKYGEVYACPACTRPMMMAGRAVDYALTNGEPITVPCRCGHEVEIGASGVIV